MRWKKRGIVLYLSMRPRSITSREGARLLGETLPNSQPAWLLRYFSVGASVGLAALLRVPLHPILGNKVAFITLVPAIVYSAWIAGWFIIAPAASVIRAEPADPFSLLFFVLVGAAISAVGHGMKMILQIADRVRLLIGRLPERVTSRFQVRRGISWKKV